MTDTRRHEPRLPEGDSAGEIRVRPKLDQDTLAFGSLVCLVGLQVLSAPSVVGSREISLVSQF